MTNQEITKFVFCFNPNANGGEAVTLTTCFFSNGDNLYSTHELSMESYGNSVTLNLSGEVITPEILRRLADKLESAKSIAETYFTNN